METCYVYLSTPDTWYEIFVIRELQHEDGCMAGDQWRLPLHLIINKDPFSIYLITKSYDSDPDQDSDEDESDVVSLSESEELPAISKRLWQQNSVIEMLIFKVSQ